jgi:glutamine---fructose-6-phosphate transaminase (isomerizing)
MSLGAHTRAEIMSQPECWTACLRDLKEDAGFFAAAKSMPATANCVFVGCGSSYYLALTSAAMWRAMPGTDAVAVPASEVMLYPELSAPRRAATAVIISRSGKTSEALQAAEFFQQRGTPTIAVTCVPDSPLAKVATAAVAIAAADEQSTVMTRSFSSMLLALQAVRAKLLGDRSLLDGMCSLPETVGQQMMSLDARLGELASHPFRDYVFLGQGPYFGLACEAMLKVKEMSNSYAQAYHTLEFRHGPKSILSPDVLVTFLLSVPKYEADVLKEVKSLGGHTLVICQTATEDIRSAADSLIELELALPEYAQLPAWVVPGQLLGFHTALAKGLDPDKPRHLTRVVMLAEK